MKKNREYTSLIMFRDKKIIARRINGKGEMEYRFNGTPDTPNIPFYNFIFEKGFYPKYVNEIKEKDGWRNIKRKDTLILCDDDCIGISKRALYEFTKVTLKAKKVGTVFQYEVIAGGLDEYVAVSRSCRLITITYCNKGDIYQKFIPNGELSLEEMKTEIKSVHRNLAIQDIPVFLNGESLKEFKDIGTVVRLDEIFKNAEKMKIKETDESRFV